MNIVMMTNTYLPHVGGVARSVAAFSDEYRRRGHRVLIVAPTFENMPDDEHDVVRVPALQRFNGSDFSVALPVPWMLTSALAQFRADIIHSHHPFLIGFTALRVAHAHDLPLIFTHHTKYEDYTHYMPGDSPGLKRFVIALASNYANLCDQVFAPSESVAALLQHRGVATPIAVVPTGVDLDRFEVADGTGFRRAFKIPTDAFVIGHLGRLAKEKNLEFLAHSIIEYIQQHPQAENIYCLMVGDGPMATVIKRLFADNHLAHHLIMTGSLGYCEVVHAYDAMDVYSFASKTETQGMVITEAMTAGVPVVALDAPGVREVVRDRYNGRLLSEAEPEQFAAAIRWVETHIDSLSLRNNCRATAHNYSMQLSADRALLHFRRLQRKAKTSDRKDYFTWTSTLNYLEAEMTGIKGIASALTDALDDPQRS